MNNPFTITIQASKMQDLYMHTNVYSLAEIPNVICVKLPDNMPRDMDLSGVFDLNTNKEVEFEGHITRDEHRPWIDIDSELLDLAVGQHVYRLTFSKENVKLTATCWFGYIVQNTFVDKPYIYMTPDRVASDVPQEGT